MYELEMEKNWIGFGWELFRIKGSVIPKGFVWGIASAVVAIGLWFYWNRGGWDESASEGRSTVAIAFSAYSFALSFLVVYRMQLAYGRYWEAAGDLYQMRAEWLEAAGSLFSFCSHEKHREVDVLKFKHLLVRIMSQLHRAAMERLSGKTERVFPVIDPLGIDPEHRDFLDRNPDRVECLIMWFEHVVIDNMHDGVLNVPAPILTRVFQELNGGMIQLKSAMKIRHIPVPFPMVQVTLIMLIFHSMCTPIIASLIMYNWRWAGTMAFTSVFGVWSINYMAQELENPFLTGVNCLELEKYQDDANRVLMTMLAPGMQHAPFLAGEGKEGYKTTEVEWAPIRESEEAVLNDMMVESTQRDPNAPALTARVSRFGALIGAPTDDLGIPEVQGSEVWNHSASNRSEGSNGRSEEAVEKLEEKSGAAPLAGVACAIQQPRASPEPDFLDDFQKCLNSSSAPGREPDERPQALQEFLTALKESESARKHSQDRLLQSLNDAAKMAEEQLKHHALSTKLLIRALDGTDLSL